MRKGYALSLMILATTAAWAQPPMEMQAPRPLLNRITLQLHAEQWLTTKTALVNIMVNAAVTDQGIEKIQTTVMEKLSQLSNKADWHILSFDRQQDKSGLESLQILAQARLNQEELTPLRNKTKNISVPGETFTVESIQFTPSETEIQQANTALRQDLYQQAKNEIESINKIYPEQKYFLHNITFSSQPPAVPAPMVRENAYMAKAMTAAVAGPALTVGNKAELYANVVVSSLVANAGQ